MIRAFVLVIGLLAALPATAQSVQEQIVSQLAGQGFTKIELSRTFLGRVRVLASSDKLVRELVFNPATGEILRDYWEEIDSDETPPRVFIQNPDRNNGSDNSQSSNVDEDHDNDDKYEDEKDDHDEDKDEDENE